MAVTRSTLKGKEMPTIVEVGSYEGVFRTMKSIVYEEGESTTGPADLVRGSKASLGVKPSRIGLEKKKKKGQGVEGLWRGWRVGMWGLIGVWGAASLGGAGSKTGEF